MKARFGFIGEKEIEAAKEELIKQYRYDDCTWIEKNIWFEKPRTGNYVKGYTYDDVEEVLTHETNCMIDTFTGMERVEEYMEEYDYSFSIDEMKEFETIFGRGETAYMIDGEIGNDRDSLCWSKIEDGQYLWKGTVEEAYNTLSEEHNDIAELIAIGVLQ